MHTCFFCPCLFTSIYFVALRAPTLSSGFPISPLLIQIDPGLQNMRNISGIMTKLKPHAYAFFCLAEHERPYALDISTVFSKLSRADRCFLDLCWPSKLTRISSKLFSFTVFLQEWPRNFMFDSFFLFPWWAIPHLRFIDHALKTAMGERDLSLAPFWPSKHCAWEYMSLSFSAHK